MERIYKKNNKVYKMMERIKYQEKGGIQNDGENKISRKRRYRK